MSTVSRVLNSYLKLLKFLTDIQLNRSIPVDTQARNVSESLSLRLNLILLFRCIRNVPMKWVSSVNFPSISENTTHNLTPSKIRAFIVMKIDLSGVLKPRGVAIIITDLHNRFLDLGHNPLKLFLTMGRIAAEYCVS